MIGRTVAHYKITEKLGEGGMGVVYKAEDTTLKRTVALKFLPHSAEVNEAERARFLQEAQAAAALNHPNICTIYDIQSEEGVAGEEARQFIVMEYVEGKTLERLVPLPSLEGAIACAIQIGEALGEAHGKGVVHRDIKADNIMVSAKNQVKVMDFGLAKLKGSLKLTKTSSTVGTLAYMAPEQIAGGEVDARSDIFSFGIVLYQMLTGHMPFRGEHEAAMVYAIVNEDPTPVQKYMPEVPPELVHILARALEKDPAERYQSVSEMVIDLRRLKKQSAPVSPAAVLMAPSQKIVARRNMWLVRVITPAALVIVGAGVAALLLSRGRELNPGMKFRTIQVPFENVWYADVSLDGNWLYFPAADENGNFDVYMMNLAGGTPRRITNDSCKMIQGVAISPDGSTVLYARRSSRSVFREIVSVPTLGGTGRVIVEEGDSPSWRPDGKRIGYLVMRVPAAGKAAFEFWTCALDGADRQREFGDTVVFRPALRRGFYWSWDGKAVTWVRNYPEGHCELFIHNLENGSEHQLTHDRKIAEDGLWSPTGHIVYSSNRTGNFNLWMVPVSGGEPIQVTRGTGPDVPMWISPEGNRLVYSERQQIGQVKIADLQTHTVRQLTFEEHERGSPSISQDGQAIFFPEQEGGAVSSLRNIYRVDTQGKNVRKITDDSTFKIRSFPSPDGKWIAYSSWPRTEPADSSRVYLDQADNPGHPRLVRKGTIALWFSDSQFVVWSPPHTYLASVGREGCEKIGEDSTRVVPVLDAKSLLVWDDRRGSSGVWLVPWTRERGSGSPGPRLMLKSVLDVSRIARRSNELFYVTPSTGELRKVSLISGTDRPAGMTLPAAEGGFDVSGDGRLVVYTENYFKARFVLIEDLFR